MNRKLSRGVLAPRRVVVWTMLGLALAAALWLGFIPVVTWMYASHASPAVSTDSSALGLLALAANIAVVAVMLAAQRRGSDGHER